MEIWKEYYVYGINFTSLPAGTGNVFTDGEIRIDSDAEFEFIKTMFSPNTTRVRVRYRDDTNGRFLMKNSQDIRTIGGTNFVTVPAGLPTPNAFIPFIWPKPYIIPAATTFGIQVADFNNSGTTNPRFAFHGSKIRYGSPPWKRRYRATVPYVYPLSATGTVEVAANGSVSISIPTDNDAHFIVHKIVGARDGACTVTVKDGARDSQWMNQAIHFDNLIGNGMYPNILPSPRFVAHGSTLVVTIADLSGASNTVEINFIGEKVYE